MSDFDELLDRTLRAYAAQEPAPGLEARVLERVRRDAPRAAWWTWAGWAAAACGAAFMVGYATRPLETLTIHPVWRVEAPPFATVAAASPAARRRPRIGEGERALMQFVAQHPDEAIETAAKLQNPIAIGPIEIQPLAINELEAPEEKK